MFNQFPLGEPPRDNVEEAAKLYVKYRKAGLTSNEFSTMFSRMVSDPVAVFKRVAELVKQ